MRDIPGFGVWLAIMTAMSGVVAALGCGPDKPGVGGPGAKPPAADAAAIGSGDANIATRPPPVQPPDGGTDRALDAASSGPSPAGCAPAAPDGAVAAARDAGGDVSVDGAAGDAGVTASGGRSGTGGNASGGADGAGGRAVSADAGAPGLGGNTGVAGGAGGKPPGSGGATTGGNGGAATGGRPPGTGGAAGTGGAPSAGGAPGSGGAPGTAGAFLGSGGAAGAAGAAGSAGGGVPPVAGDLAIVELLINPAGTDTGREWIEILNRTGHAIALAGLHLADAVNDAAVDLGAGPAVLPAGGRAVLVQSADATKNGGITAATAPVVGVFGTLVSLNNDADSIAVCAGSCTAGGTVLDRVSWDAALGTGYDGHALVLDEGGKRCPATTAFGDAGSFGTPGAANAPCP